MSGTYERRLRWPSGVDLLPDPVLVSLPDAGHSALDTHQLAALHVAHAVAENTLHRLPRLAPQIAALPRRGAPGLLRQMITGTLALELAVSGRPAA